MGEEAQKKDGALVLPDYEKVSNCYLTGRTPALIPNYFRIDFKLVWMTRLKILFNHKLVLN
jgi:hypothetical protein